MDTFLQDVTFPYTGNVLNVHELVMKKIKESKEEFNINMVCCTWYFKRCPSGTNNTPLNFQRMLKQLLDDLIGLKISIDDLIGGVKRTGFIYQTTMKFEDVSDGIRDQKIEESEKKNKVIKQK